MMKVNDWSAIRSGATMTITGRSQTQPVRLTGVDKIEQPAGGTVTAYRDGKPVAELA